MQKPVINCRAWLSIGAVRSSSEILPSDWARVGPPSPRFTCKRPASHGHRNSTYINKLHIRLPCITTDVEIDHLLGILTPTNWRWNFLRYILAEEYFTYASNRKIRCSSMYSIITIIYNLTPEKQHNFTLNMRTTFLSIRQIQLDWLDSGSLNANLADGAPNLAPVQGRRRTVCNLTDLAGQK